MDWLQTKRGIWLGHLSRATREIQNGYVAMVEAKHWVEGLAVSTLQRTNRLPPPRDCGEKPEHSGDKPGSGSGAPAASEALAGVPPLDELPSKLSALSDLLENAGATDAEVEQVRISPASTPLAARLVFSGP